MRKALEGEPLLLQSLQIENIDFSKEYIRSVEQRMQAEVEVQRLRQNAEREKVQAQITVTKANADADSLLQGPWPKPLRRACAARRRLLPSVRAAKLCATTRP